MRKPKMLQFSDHQANTVAVAALRNLLASMGPVVAQPEGKSLLALLDSALQDRSPNAMVTALGLLLAAAGAWEATAVASGGKSCVLTFEQLRAETGGRRTHDA